jgi:hypothetical protein
MPGNYPTFSKRLHQQFNPLDRVTTGGQVNTGKEKFHYSYPVPIFRTRSCAVFGDDELGQSLNGIKVLRIDFVRLDQD